MGALRQALGHVHERLLSVTPDADAQAAEFDDYLRRIAPGARVEDVPMLRGRIVALNGTPAERIRNAKALA